MWINRHGVNTTRNFRSAFITNNRPRKINIDWCAEICIVKGHLNNKVSTILYSAYNWSRRRGNGNGGRTNINIGAKNTRSR